MKYWVEGTKYDNFFYIASTSWNQEFAWRQLDLTKEEYLEIIKPTAYDFFFNTREEAQEGLNRLEPYIMMHNLVAN